MFLLENVRAVQAHKTLVEPLLCLTPEIFQGARKQDYEFISSIGSLGAERCVRCCFPGLDITDYKPRRFQEFPNSGFPS